MNEQRDPAKSPLVKYLVQGPEHSIDDSGYDLRRQFCDPQQYGSVSLAVLTGILLGTTLALIVAVCHSVASVTIRNRRRNQTDGSGQERITKLQLEFNRVMTYIAVSKGLIPDPIEQSNPGTRTGTAAATNGDVRDALVFNPAYRNARIDVYLQMCAYFGMVPTKKTTTQSHSVQ